MAQINKVKLPNGTTYDIVPSASDITIKSKLYFEAVSEDNVTYKKLVAEYVAPDPEDFDTTGTLTVYDLDGNVMFTMDTSGNRFNLLRVVNTLIAGTLITSDVVKPSGSTWDGTNTSLTTAISLLNSTLVRKDKMYRFRLSGKVSAGESFAYTSEYAPDNDIYIDGTNIKFRRSGMVRIFVHLAGSPTSQASRKRVWARLLQGSTVVATLIQYGDYTSQSTERIMSVSDSISASIMGVEPILLNPGGIGPSYVEIQWIS